MLSRRQFLGTAAGATSIVLGSGLWMPGQALAWGDGAAPKPIPGGSQFLGSGTEVFHVFVPGRGNEPSTIFDFDGFVGIAMVDGTGTGTDTRTGATTRLTFDNDMRFMQGAYIGVDGKKHWGTFGFIWLDLYVGAVASGDQIQDFNPGIASSGLFWTIRIPDENVEVDFNNARASTNLSDVQVKDFGTGLNSLLRGPSVHADVSFHIRWSGVKERVKTRDKTNRFAGSYIEDTATIAWSAQEKGFKFVSDPANTSTTVFAQIGRERNGVFF